MGLDAESFEGLGKWDVSVYTSDFFVLGPLRSCKARVYLGPGICINTLYIITLNVYIYIYIQIRTLVINLNL